MTESVPGQQDQSPGEMAGPHLAKYAQAKKTLQDTVNIWVTSKHPSLVLFFLLSECDFVFCHFINIY